MRYFLSLCFLISTTVMMGQAYNGSGDNKFQVGLNLQNGATGLNLSYDLGFGENISLGVSSTYAMGVEEERDADFADRFDIKARFNAHLGNVIQIDEAFDLYPGLNLSLKNFGGHVGMRYFFTEGFGIFSEAAFPIAKYNTEDLTPAEEIHNQFTFNIGASFNL